jgi:hypothetical protein
MAVDGTQFPVFKRYFINVSNIEMGWVGSGVAAIPRGKRHAGFVNTSA